MRPTLILCLPLLAAACTADTLNYVGTMRPVAGTCDPTTQAVLTRRDTTIIFAPAAGTLELHGQLSNEKILAARLTLTDPNKQPYSLTFRGQLDGKRIDGTYTTPRCRYTVNLSLTTD
jgi:hypothetical protein